MSLENRQGFSIIDIPEVREPAVLKAAGFSLPAFGGAWGGASFLSAKEPLDGNFVERIFFFLFCGEILANKGVSCLEDLLFLHGSV